MGILVRLLIVLLVLGAVSYVVWRTRRARLRRRRRDAWRARREQEDRIWHERIDKS